MRDKLLSRLGLCRKAGRLACGFDAAAEAVRKGQAALVLTARDLSPKSGKEIRFIAEKYGVEVVLADATIDDIEQKTGRRAGILAVTDRNLAESVRREAVPADEEE